MARNDLFSQRNFQEFLQHEFEADKNPFYLWWAFQIARESRSSVPRWVLAYLDQCAANLLKGETPDQALSLTQAGHKRRRFETAFRNLRIRMKLERLRTRYPDRSIETIIGQLATEPHLGEHVGTDRIGCGVAR